MTMTDAFCLPAHLARDGHAVTLSCNTVISVKITIPSFNFRPCSAQISQDLFYQGFADKCNILYICKSFFHVEGFEVGEMFVADPHCPLQEKSRNCQQGGKK